MFEMSLLVALVASHPVAERTWAPLPATAVGQVTRVAQAEDVEDDDGNRVRKPGGLGRFMKRKAVKDMINRLPRPMRPSTPGARDDDSNDERQGSPQAAARQPASGRKPSPSPRPSAQPSRGSSSSAKEAGGSGAGESGKVDFAEAAKKGKFSFDFAKAEILDLVKAISKMTQRNFIVPEKLKSQRLTILSPTKISPTEAYQVFLTALAANGVTVVRSGKFYKLVQSKNAIKQPIPTCVGPEDVCPQYSDLMVTVLIHLLHVEASQINGVIKALVSKEGALTIFQPTNAIIVSEYAPNLRRLRRIIDALDVPGFQDELQIVEIRFATASEIADKLTQVFEVQPKRGKSSGRPGGKKPTRPRPGDKGSKGDSGDEGEVRISKIVPDDRTNQIIIKANRKSFDAILNLISKLDVPLEDVEQGKVHVYYLENASAEDLASTLSSLAQGQGQKRTPSRGSSKGGIKNKSAVLFEGEVKITADKSTNSLIIVASGRDFTALKKLIGKLDKPRRQVYVEAAILEVTVTDEDRYALDWHAPGRFAKGDLPGDAGGAGTLGFLQSGSFTGGGGTEISPTLRAMSPEGLFSILKGSLAGVVGKGITIPVGDGEVTFPSFGVLLQWLQTSTNSRVLSTPHILATDNEEASIEVGEKIPFRRGTSIPNLGGLGSSIGSSGGGFNAQQALQSMSGAGGLFSSIDRIDVSLKLSLTPQINERGKVRLEIDQQIEDISGTEPMTGQPKTSKRAAKTVVVVDDQQTIVLGGLMRDKVTDSESKMPILGDLPLIGWLFKKHSKTVDQVSLLLILTPYIIRDATDFQRIFERKLIEYEEFAAQYYGSLPEYRAHIDYSRKNGPFAYLSRAMLREQSKIENGGQGDGSELLIGPDGEQNVIERSQEAEIGVEEEGG